MSFLGPISYSGYGFPSFGLGYSAPFFTPSPLYSYSDPYLSYGSSFGGRSFYGSLFSPTFGGIPFMPSFGDRYNFDLMNAGAIISTWGNIIQGDPFYRAAYSPWLFGSYVPSFLPFVPAPYPFFGSSAPDNSSQSAPVQATQPTQQGQEHVRGSQGEEGTRRYDDNSKLVEQLEKENEQLKQMLGQAAGNGEGQAGSTSSGRAGGHGIRKKSGDIRAEDQR